MWQNACQAASAGRRSPGAVRRLIDTEFSSTILSQIPGLRQLINVLKRNIVAVEARGTFRDPNLSLKAFPLKDLVPDKKMDEKKN